MAAGLRVAHLGKYYHPVHGGIETLVRELAHSQAALGCSVRVICMGHDRGAATRVEADGPVEVVRLRRAASVGKLDHCPDLAGAIRDCDCDVLHLHTPNPSMILGLLRSGNRRPLVISHHSDVVRQRLRRILFGPLERVCYRRAEAILMGTPTYISGSKTLLRNAHRVAAVPYGLDLEPFLRPSAEVEAHGRAIRRVYPGPIWFAIGRHVYYKGFETAVRAMTSTPGTLLLAGDGPLRDSLERLARRLNLGDRLRFLGRLPGKEDLIAHLLAATAFWFPSNARSESYGIVQVEAMASGCPVINTAIPHSGVPWVSPDGVSGLTVSVDDPADLSSAACRLANDPALREELAEGGRRRAIQEFGIELMARRTVEVYRAVMAGAGPGTRMDRRIVHAAT